MCARTARRRARRVGIRVGPGAGFFRVMVHQEWTFREVWLAESSRTGRLRCIHSMEEPPAFCAGQQQRDMPNHNGHITELAQMFRILSDETRLRVLVSLQESGEMNVGQLCDTLGVPQPTVSHHLGILRMGQLVTNRRHGKQIYYSINSARRDKYSKAVRNLLRQQDGLRFGNVVLGLAEA